PPSLRALSSSCWYATCAPFSTSASDTSMCCLRSTPMAPGWVVCTVWQAAAATARTATRRWRMRMAVDLNRTMEKNARISGEFRRGQAYGRGAPSGICCRFGLGRVAGGDEPSQPLDLPAQDFVDQWRPFGQRPIGEATDIVSEHDARAATGGLDLPGHAAVDAE